MTGRRRPAVAQTAGQVPGRELGPVMREKQDDMTSRFMGESVEDALELGQ